MGQFLFSCQEGYRVDDDGVHVRVVLCGRPANLYRIPLSPHELALCNEHVKRYPDAVEVVPANGARESP